jgi:hypothetical protein
MACEQVPSVIGTAVSTRIGTWKPVKLAAEPTLPCDLRS